MLSSTADHLYWMARSMERAESAARMLDITYRMSLLKHATQEPFQEWSAVLSISGLHQEFGQRYPEVNAGNVVQFMALDETNPSSIISSLSSARENARAVRGTITSEVWENLNHTWLMMRDRRAAGIAADGVAEFFEWVKERSHLSRGIAYGTMLRGEPFRFIRLGTFLERADNTARILDVKYHILLPSLQDVGGAADYYQWGALLRSVSSFESYRRVYSDVITPKRVAEMLILNPDRRHHGPGAARIPDRDPGPALRHRRRGQPHLLLAIERLTDRDLRRPQPSASVPGPLTTGARA